MATERIHRSVSQVTAARRVWGSCVGTCRWAGSHAYDERQVLAMNRSGGYLHTGNLFKQPSLEGVRWNSNGM
jgi:hypothetical protein